MDTNLNTLLQDFNTPAAGVDALLAELGDWLDAVYDIHRNTPWQGIHDEATFVTAWAGYYALTGDERVLTLGRTLRDSWLTWAADHMTHGYHREQEAHHGPEHYIIFLDWLQRVDPDDERTQAAILDAAHHVGNWVEGVPAWYNRETRRFYSDYIGTEQVGDEGLNRVEHLRFVHLALLAYRASGDPRYRDFAHEYAGEWIDLILGSDELPVYLDPGDGSLRKYKQGQASFLGAAPKDLSDISRLEIHVANGTPRLLLELAEVTGDPRYTQAADRLLAAMLPEVADPFANPVGYLLGLYRRRINRSSVDTDILARLGEAPDLGGYQLGMEPEVEWPPYRGFGKRMDMPAWYIQNGARQALNWPSPAALALGYEISGNSAYATAALALALGKLQLARRAYRDGRHHGCTARSIAAICRGHGRNWGIGDVSGVLNNPAIIKAWGKAPLQLVKMETN